MLNYSRTTSSRVSLISTLCLLVFATGCSRDPNVRKHKYLDSGIRYEKLGKNKEAIIQFSNALKIDRNFADAHFELGKTYLAMGNGNAGYAEITRAVAIAPKNLAARIELAKILLTIRPANQQQEIAIVKLAGDQAHAIQSIDPNSPDAYAIMAAVAQRNGNKDEARADMDKAVSLDPNRAAFHVSEGLLDASSAQGMPQAQQELEKAISLDPKQTNAHLILAEVLEKKGDRAGAEQQDLAAIKESPDSLPARESLAGLYLRAGDQGKAEQVIKQATDDLAAKDLGSGLMKDFYTGTGHPEKIEAAYQEMVAKHPKNTGLRIAYAQILVEKHENDKAAPLLADLSKQNSKNPMVEILNASLLMSSGNIDAAMTTMQQAAKDSPQDPDVQIALGRAAYTKSQRENAQDSQADVTLAEASFQAAAKLQPRAIIPQIGLAQIAQQRGDYGLLGQIAEQTIALNPRFSDAYLWRGDAEEGKAIADGKPAKLGGPVTPDPAELQKAEQDFQTALTVNPKSVAAMYTLGRFRLAQNKLPEATTLFENALSADPNAAEPLARLTEMSMRQKDPAKAIARIQQQIAKSPQNPVFYDELAAIQMFTKDFAGARDSAGKAIKLNPEDKLAVKEYADAELAAGDIGGAIATWQQWSDKHPKDADALARVGTFEGQKGDSAKAEEYYRKALQLDPNQFLSANNLAYLLLTKKNDSDGALTLAQTARRIAPNAPASADTLAWVYYAKGRYASARDLLEDAVKQQPQDAAMQYHLGMTYIKLGDKVQALAHLKKAQAVALPSDAETQKDVAAALAQLG